MKKLFIRLSYFLAERRYLALKKDAAKDIIEITKLKASLESEELSDAVKFALQSLYEKFDESKKNMLKVDSSFLKLAAAYAVYNKSLSK